MVNIIIKSKDCEYRRHKNMQGGVVPHQLSEEKIFWLDLGSSINRNLAGEKRAKKISSWGKFLSKGKAL